MTIIIISVLLYSHSQELTHTQDYLQSSLTYLFSGYRKVNHFILLLILYFYIIKPLILREVHLRKLFYLFNRLNNYCNYYILVLLFCSLSLYGGLLISVNICSTLPSTDDRPVNTLSYSKKCLRCRLLIFS